MSVCFLNSLPNGEFSNLLIVAAFSVNTFPGKTSLPVQNSYIPTFHDDKADILAVCLSNLYWAFFSQYCDQLF